jgi:hypothetical protein
VTASIALRAGLALLLGASAAHAQSPRRSQRGEVLPLDDARLAHEMLAGTPHKRGKIVLTVDDRP